MLSFKLPSCGTHEGSQWDGREHRHLPEIDIKNQLKRRSRMSGYVGTLQHVQSSCKKL